MPDRLSALDTSFLAAERPGLPLHIGGMAVLEATPLLDGEGRLDIDAIRRTVATNLEALPRFRRKLLASIGPGLPTWVDAPQFDLRDHVRVVSLDGVGDEAFFRLAMELQREPLPRDRPLWELVFVEGIGGDRVGFVEKVHHALVDGVSGAEALAVLLSVDPDACPDVASDWVAERLPAPVEQWAHAAAHLLDGLTAGLRGATAVARHPLGAVTPLAAVAALARRDGLAPRCSLNTAVGPHRRYLACREALADVKAIGRVLGCKVNDVVLAAVTHGLRDLLAHRGELDGLEHVRALVPVSIRTEDEHLALGNRVSGLIARLPVGEPDPLERLEAIIAEVETRRSGPDVATMAWLLGSADIWAQAILGPLSNLTVHRQPLANLVVTNVPGPQVPLYLRRARLLEALPFVPLGGNTSVGIAVLSYDGQLNVGITVDPDACPDADVLADGITAGFQMLGVLALR